MCVCHVTCTYVIYCLELGPQKGGYLGCLDICDKCDPLLRSLWYSADEPFADCSLRQVRHVRPQQAPDMCAKCTHMTEDKKRATNPTGCLHTTTSTAAASETSKTWAPKARI